MCDEIPKKNSTIMRPFYHFPLNLCNKSLSSEDYNMLYWNLSIRKSTKFSRQIIGHLSYSKHPTRCNNRKIYCLVIQTAQHVLGITMPIIRNLSNCRCSLWFPSECGGGSVLSRGRLRTLPSPHSDGNQRLQWQFDGLLMMDIVMPETCWAVKISILKSNWCTLCNYVIKID